MLFRALTIGANDANWPASALCQGRITSAAPAGVTAPVGPPRPRVIAV